MGITQWDFSRAAARATPTTFVLTKHGQTSRVGSSDDKVSLLP